MLPPVADEEELEIAPAAHQLDAQAVCHQAAAYPRAPRLSSEEIVARQVTAVILRGHWLPGRDPRLHLLHKVPLECIFQARDETEPTVDALGA